MSLYDYQRGSELAKADEPFYGLIMAAMQRADSHNFRALRQAFPLIHDELQARYSAPGGILPTDPEASE